MLVIGAHKLEGEIKKLPKPFLIMQKQRKRKRAASVSNDPVTPGGNGDGGKRAALGEETPMSGGRGAWAGCGANGDRLDNGKLSSILCFDRRKWSI